MNTDWSLDICYTELWYTVYEGPSCDACKNHARKIFRMQKQERGILYRIYAGNGEQLFQVSYSNQGNRMRWRYGNLRPRTEQYKGDQP